MHQMGQYAAIQLQSDLVNNVVLPHFYVFAPIVYAAEVLTGVSLMLGLFTRLFAVIGALQILNLWLGLYNAPGEWPWTYFFLLVLQFVFAVHCYGRSLGLDALLSSSARGPGTRSVGSRLIGAAS
jgi:thiosulfate dehydrogenase [quinone] large subunit